MAALRGEIAVSKQVERFVQETNQRIAFEGVKARLSDKTHVQSGIPKPNSTWLTINTSKCVFGVSILNFVTQQGTKPLPEKVEPILNTQSLKIKELQPLLN
ncbi:hypothetical protein NPIL_34841 [Nephila pilipes]|uniref:Uncharacterized protein n=1 Tax=Nephila pilipes TaxID=299642 RepID=A0A8X6T5C0_NEPPI|nr:hypothetical protein NPIL_34841 [Nephila pilipes]